MQKNKYYKKRNGEYYKKYTKNEICDKINIYDKNTYLFFLQELDIPYIPSLWNELSNRHNTSSGVFGRYLARCRLASYKDLGYQDSKLFNKKIQNFQIQTIHPQPNDIIVITFNPEKITLAEAHDNFRYIQDEYPNNRVVGFPHGINLEFMEWQKLYDFVMSIKPKGENINE